MLTKSAEYALRATYCLAFLGREGPVPASELAERVGVPENYLSKVLHRLQREGVLTARRGPGGGFSLARHPTRVSLAQVVGPFEGKLLHRHCLLGRPECRDDAPCAAHDAWLDVSGRMRRFFRDTSLQDLRPTGDGCRDAPAAEDAVAR